jgi:hypothetical protein
VVFPYKIAVEIVTEPGVVLREFTPIALLVMVQNSISAVPVSDTLDLWQHRHRCSLEACHNRLRSNSHRYLHRCIEQIQGWKEEMKGTKMPILLI